MHSLYVPIVSSLVNEQITGVGRYNGLISKLFNILPSYFRQERLNLYWCWSSWDAMVYWKESVSVVRASPTESSSRNSVRDMRFWHPIPFQRVSWMGKSLLRRWYIVLFIIVKLAVDRQDIAIVWGKICHRCCLQHFFLVQAFLLSISLRCQLFHSCLLLLIKQTVNFKQLYN